MFCTSTVHIRSYRPGSGTIGWRVIVEDDGVKTAARVQIVTTVGTEEALIEERPILAPGENWNSRLLSARAEAQALEAYRNIFRDLP